MRQSEDEGDAGAPPAARQPLPDAAPLRGRAARRRLARTLALQALYEADTAGHDPGEVVQRLSEDGGISGEPAAYAVQLIAGVKARRAELDDLIGRSAPQWPVSQLAVIDRNLLRIAIFELLFEDETPVSVAVNEAVELAKTFGGEGSPRFINGVLGTLSANRRD